MFRWTLLVATAAATLGCAAGLIAITVFVTPGLTVRAAALVATVELLLLALGLATRSAAASTVAIAWLAASYAFAAAGAGDPGPLETAGFAIGILVLAELVFMARGDGDALLGRKILASARVVAASAPVVAVVAAAGELKSPESAWLVPLGAAAVIGGALGLLRALRGGGSAERAGRPASPPPSERFGRPPVALASRRK